MQQRAENEQQVPLDDLGRTLGALRLCEPGPVAEMCRSLERHGQLQPLALFEQASRLEIIDGFKRVRAARALGWPTLRVARSVTVSAPSTPSCASASCTRSAG